MLLHFGFIEALIMLHKKTDLFFGIYNGAINLTRGSEFTDFMLEYSHKGERFLVLKDTVSGNALHVSQPSSLLSVNIVNYDTSQSFRLVLLENRSIILYKDDKCLHFNQDTRSFYFNDCKENDFTVAEFDIYSEMSTFNIEKPSPTNPIYSHFE